METNMSMFKQYLQENFKEYHYRIKTIVPLEGEHLDMIESILRKYDVKSVSKVVKTPLQAHPLEFYEETNKEVYILDVVTGMPLSTFILQNELVDALNTYEKALLVRGANDPIEMQTQEILDRQDKDYEVKLSTSPDYLKSEESDEPPAFGDDFNQEMLSSMARARLKVASDVKADDAAFNKGIPGVKPVYGAGSKSKGPNVAPTGNYDDEKDIKNGVR